MYSEIFVSNHHQIVYLFAQSSLHITNLPATTAKFILDHTSNITLSHLPNQELDRKEEGEREIKKKCYIYLFNHYSIVCTYIIEIVFEVFHIGHGMEYKYLSF